MLSTEWDISQCFRPGPARPRIEYYHRHDVIKLWVPSRHIPDRASSPTGEARKAPASTHDAAQAPLAAAIADVPVAYGLEA